MGMFDQEIPGYVSGPQRIRRAGQGLADQLAPGIKRMTGYESPKRKAMAIAGKADLSSMKSIQDTYQQIQQINPTAATAWIKDVMPQAQELGKRQQAVQTSRDSRGPMQKAIEFAAQLEGGCPEGPDGKACWEKALQTATDYKRLNAEVNRGSKGLGDLTKVTFADGSKAHMEEGKFEVMMGLLDNISTGPFTESIILPAKRLAAYFGWGADSTASMEAFQSKAMTMALDFVNDTKGAVSDKEFAAFLAAAPGLQRTKEGNRLLLEMAQEVARFRQRKSLAMSNWITAERKEGRTPSDAGWMAHFEQWKRIPQNKLKGPASMRLEEALGKGKGTTRPDGGPLDLDAAAAAIEAM
jgi:hypothetical protein